MRALYRRQPPPTIDCTFDRRAAAGDALRDALDRIRQEAEEAVRGGCRRMSS